MLAVLLSCPPKLTCLSHACQPAGTSPHIAVIVRTATENNITGSAAKAG